MFFQDKAVVYLFDPSGKSGVTGNVTFTKTSEGITVSGKIIGLTEGLHGFHIHQLGHIAPGCTGTGGHFNPLKVIYCFNLVHSAFMKHRQYFSFVHFNLVSMLYKL